jgi:hypothetical protein
MNSLNFSAAKCKPNTGPHFPGITDVNHFIAGPQAKAAKKPRTSPCKNLQKGQKCLARERPQDE